MDCSTALESLDILRATNIALLIKLHILEMDLRRDDGSSTGEFLNAIDTFQSAVRTTNSELFELLNAEDPRDQMRGLRYMSTLKNVLDETSHDVHEVDDAMQERRSMSMLRRYLARGAHRDQKERVTQLQGKLRTSMNKMSLLSTTSRHYQSTADELPVYTFTSGDETIMAGPSNYNDSAAVGQGPLSKNDASRSHESNKNKSRKEARDQQDNIDMLPAVSAQPPPKRMSD